ncbi:hypothetical protein BH11PSE3_BH11PSE3_44750 [soil metagenome]
MLRLLSRALVSRFFVAGIELVLALPMFLGVWESSHALWVLPDLHVAMETVTGIGIIMIGLGVVLEERGALREIFGLTGGPDEAWQAGLDHSCHHAGVGQLVLGLFAEICIELIRIPNSVIYTGDVDDWLVAAGCLMITAGALLLLRHAWHLVTLAPHRTL